MRLSSICRDRTRHLQRGTTAVEFALVVPLLTLLLFGAIDGGRLVIARYMVSYAAVVGGRIASVRSTASVTAIQNAVVAAVPFLKLTTSAVAVVVNSTTMTDATFPGRPTGPPNTVTVTVTYNYRPYVVAYYKWTGWATKVLTGTSKVMAE